ncbi:MAG: hypothetical protein QXO02_08935, partial [Thermofilaceae archaeon]
MSAEGVETRWTREASIPPSAPAGSSWRARVGSPPQGGAAILDTIKSVVWRGGRGLVALYLAGAVQVQAHEAGAPRSNQGSGSHGARLLAVMSSITPLRPAYREVGE